MKYYILSLGILLCLSKEFESAPCEDCPVTDAAMVANRLNSSSEGAMSRPGGAHWDVEGSYQNDYTNLAWLVTPGLFMLGVMYVIYKCCRDGLCNCKRLRRLRRRAAALDEEGSTLAARYGYVPLSQVTLLSSQQLNSEDQAPPREGTTTRRQLLLVHNRTYCVTIETGPMSEGQPPRRRILVQPLSPPSYEEALAQGTDGPTGEPGMPANPPHYTENAPPCYSIAMGGTITPAPSLEDHIALKSVMSALGDSSQISSTAAENFATNRRRHRSLQDTHARRASGSVGGHHGERHRNLSDQQSRRPRLWSRGSIPDGESAERGGTGSIASSLSSSLAHLHLRNFGLTALRDVFWRDNETEQEGEALLDGDNQSDGPPTTEVCILHPAGLPPGLSETDFTTLGQGLHISALSAQTNVTQSAPATTTTQSSILFIKGNKRGGHHQVSFNDRVIQEDSGESSDSINNCMRTAQLTGGPSPSPEINEQLRHRHCSAPESNQSLSRRIRHSSTNS